MAPGTSSCGAVLLYCPHNICEALDSTIVHPSALCDQKGAVTHPLPGCLQLPYGREQDCKVEMLVNSRAGLKCVCSPLENPQQKKKSSFHCTGRMPGLPASLGFLHQCK